MKVDSREIVEAYAQPGEGHIIDAIHPVTGLGLYSGETLEQIRVRYPAAERVSMDAWLLQKAERQHTPITWSPTTAEQYEDMMNVLPPAAWGREGFLVGEPDTHSARDGAPMFAAYRQLLGAYLVANRAMTRAEFKIEMAKP